MTSFTVAIDMVATIYGVWQVRKQSPIWSSSYMIDIRTLQAKCQDKCFINTTSYTHTHILSVCCDITDVFLSAVCLSAGDDTETDLISLQPPPQSSPQPPPNRRCWPPLLPVAAALIWEFLVAETDCYVCPCFWPLPRDFMCLHGKTLLLV